MSGETSHNMEFDTPEPLLIRMDEWKVLEEPTVGRITGIGPCLGITVYDKQKKKAFAGHFSNPEDYLDKQLPTYLENFSDKKGLKVNLGGMGSVSNLTDHGEMEIISDNVEERKIIRQMLVDYGFSEENIHTEWLEIDGGADMVIDTATGKVVYETYTLDELHEIG